MPKPSFNYQNHQLDILLIELRNAFPELFNEASISCGHGWSTILHQVASKIDRSAIELGITRDHPSYPWLHTVKEKLGDLRIHYHTDRPELGSKIDDILSTAMLKARQTCDVCGGKGDLNMRRGIMAVRCLQHPTFKE